MSLGLGRKVFLIIHLINKVLMDQMLFGVISFLEIILIRPLLSNDMTKLRLLSGSYFFLAWCTLNIKIGKKGVVSRRGERMLIIYGEEINCPHALVM